MNGCDDLMEKDMFRLFAYLKDKWEPCMALSYLLLTGAVVFSVQNIDFI